ncbi:Ubiquinone/menaquinone biosynthesis C-methyltransferase UbiE [Stieleria maiorica]|uniref:Ubiquinone/menaquinone biosynthesis C-methyltransferase UbiE n=1 Tax=Stieleria maiorica TaxID=2795974 RepID=A0A5B9MC24_9BACT|nr:methyltransferase domain-containing protein [Stieleria maiorica]QEF97154.1 Ubiquinone/menaquinone biosynthesis C-methyltransferase UbiE [Stieleria maiorica]
MTSTGVTKSTGLNGTITTADQSVDQNTAAGKPSWASDLRVIWHLLAHPVRGKTHAERLESFYSGQAGDYDSFRARLLHGRDELIDSLDFPTAGVWADLGSGTGENILRAGGRCRELRQIHLVDLSSSLLDVARDRLGGAGVANAQFSLADVTQWDREEESVDLVTFSYSLTMIPDWFKAIELAHRVLKPGGVIGVVDFYVSRKYATHGHRQHGWLRRSFWTHWFGADNVFLSPDHTAMLHQKFDVTRFSERLGRVPYLPLVRAPYYLFVGTKRATNAG